VSEITRTEPPSGGLAVVPVENVLVDSLADRGWSIAVAESLTAGVVAARLCLCPGTEDRVLGGVVSYSTAAKRQVLHVSAADVVTPDAARQMADAVRELFGAHVGLGVTGVAGPERQNGHPVGTVFVGWRTPEGEGDLALSCAGSPEQIRQVAADQAIRCLNAVLAG
jgi:nicotinamide-nucleotide amidase